jgi:hypothetical protein
MMGFEIKKGSYRVYATFVNGPASYTAGGFTVEFPHLTTIFSAVAAIADDNTPYKVGVSFNGNTVTIKVYQLSADTTTGAITATEVPDGTDLSGLVFGVLAIGK